MDNTPQNEEKKSRPIVFIALLITAVFVLFIWHGSVYLFPDGLYIGFRADYLGSGQVRLIVENPSDLPVNLTPNVTVGYWVTGKIASKEDNGVMYDGLKVPPRSSGETIIDLTACYDIEKLTEFLDEDDTLYLELQGRRFVFTHTWRVLLYITE